MSENTETTYTEEQIKAMYAELSKYARAMKTAKDTLKVAKSNILELAGEIPDFFKDGNEVVTGGIKIKKGQSSDLDLKANLKVSEFNALISEVTENHYDDIASKSVNSSGIKALVSVGLVKQAFADKSPLSKTLKKFGILGIKTKQTLSVS